MVSLLAAILGSSLDAFDPVALTFCLPTWEKMTKITHHHLLIDTTTRFVFQPVSDGHTDTHTHRHTYSLQESSPFRWALDTCSLRHVVVIVHSKGRLPSRHVTPARQPDFEPAFLTEPMTVVVPQRVVNVSFLFCFSLVNYMPQPTLCWRHDKAQWHNQPHRRTGPKRKTYFTCKH
ncbi:unnamed protein product [Protopolystoma xenopodis]|uniref:Secreted protein n=1 Tax=Protopolystoma xenopodis TaxID=117903 RepID=A0A448X430_9PLAT|nr:unnamed protein product [Protopolystoma xenopodis]